MTLLLLGASLALNAALGWRELRRAMWRRRKRRSGPGPQKTYRRGSGRRR